MLGKTTNLVQALVVGVLVAAAPAAFASCSSDDVITPGTPDAAPATDAADTGVATEAGGENAEAAVTCDVGALPTMPAITSEVFIEGTDGGTPAVAIGGDEAGLWTYAKISLYLPPQASGQIDPALSKIEGSGFIELGAGSFRQYVSTTTMLSTSTVGTVSRAGTQKVLGTYVATGTTVTMTITCRASTAESSSLGEVGFSRIDATHAKLHVTSQTQLGTAKLVIDLVRQP